MDYQGEFTRAVVFKFLKKNFLPFLFGESVEQFDYLNDSNKIFFWYDNKIAGCYIMRLIQEWNLP